MFIRGIYEYKIGEDRPVRISVDSRLDDAREKRRELTAKRRDNTPPSYFRWVAILARE